MMECQPMLQPSHLRASFSERQKGRKTHLATQRVEIPVPIRRVGGEDGLHGECLPDAHDASEATHQGAQRGPARAQTLTCGIATQGREPLETSGPHAPPVMRLSPWMVTQAASGHAERRRAGVSADTHAEQASASAATASHLYQTASHQSSPPLRHQPQAEPAYQ